MSSPDPDVPKRFPHRGELDSGRYLARHRAYLNGDVLDAGLAFPIATVPTTADRISILEGLVRGKRVVDLGCADHSDQIDAKLAAGQWLHGRLVASAERCLGIDIDAAAVEIVRRHGYKAVVANITTDEIPDLRDNQWDLLVLGEILEHIDDPVSFLQAIRRRHGSSVRRLVLTVPNALSWQTARAALSGVELINSDHRYWWTPYTLAKVLVRAGWVPEEFQFCEPVPDGRIGRRPGGRLRRAIRNVAFRRWPHLKIDLVMTARLA